jgi:hypothetical protein
MAVQSKYSDRPPADQDGGDGDGRDEPAGGPEVEDDNRHEGDEERDQREGHVFEVGV